MTVAQLLASQQFEWLFHHEYCEQAFRQFGSYASVLGVPQFSQDGENGTSFEGRFLAQVDSEAGPHGATSGSFRLNLPDGLDLEDASNVLNHATLDVQIETTPFQTSHR